MIKSPKQYKPTESQLLERSKQIYPDNARMADVWFEQSLYLYDTKKHLLLNGRFPKCA